MSQERVPIIDVTPDEVREFIAKNYPDVAPSRPVVGQRISRFVVDGRRVIFNVVESRA